MGLALTAPVVCRGPDMVRRERYRGVRHVRGWFGRPRGAHRGRARTGGLTGAPL